jgi:hypothetical protein
MDIANRFTDSKDACNNKRTRSPEDGRGNRYDNQRRRYHNYHSVRNPLDGHAMVKSSGAARRRQARGGRSSGGGRGTTSWETLKTKVPLYIKLLQEGTWAATWRAKRKRQSPLTGRKFGNYRVAHVQRSASSQIITESDCINDVTCTKQSR